MQNYIQFKKSNSVAIYVKLYPAQYCMIKGYVYIYISLHVYDYGDNMLILIM